MTSEERREARYQRRRARRQERRQARSDALGSVDQVFSYRKMFRYGKKCCNGVRWKQSVQNFEMHLFSGTARRRRELLAGKWKPQKGSHFTLRERGKVRPIDAPRIADRQIEKNHSNEVLVPLYTPGMIYDNGASRKGMGLHHCFKRLKQQLAWHYRRYGWEGGRPAAGLEEVFPLCSPPDHLPATSAVNSQSRFATDSRHHYPKFPLPHARAGNAAGSGAVTTRDGGLAQRRG